MPTKLRRANNLREPADPDLRVLAVGRDHLTDISANADARSVDQKYRRVTRERTALDELLDVEEALKDRI
jgi:hypothetical protein